MSTVLLATDVADQCVRPFSYFDLGLLNNLLLLLGKFAPFDVGLEALRIEGPAASWARDKSFLIVLIERMLIYFLNLLLVHDLSLFQSIESRRCIRNRPPQVRRLELLLQLKFLDA